MKFLVDALCAWLQERGHEAEHVRRGAVPDAEIARRAVAERAILISKDEDFRDLPLPDHFGFLWLRCGNVTNAALDQWLAARWDQVERWLTEGERFIELR
jgi:predicted nuclease of predicted toxin-antitoxin system